MLTQHDITSLPHDIARHYQDTFIEKKFQGVDGIHLRYVQQKEIPQADALIVLGGRTEFAEKYAELFFNLQHLNIAIYSYDHRGQGLSERLLSDPYKGYVDSFDDYSEDIKIFIDQVVSKGNHRRIFVFCHSMGGAATARFQQKYPHIVAGIMFSAPMFGINTSPASPALTENLAKTMVNIGWGRSYIFGGRAKAWKIRFADNPLTSDRQRFNRNIEFFENIPELQLGSPTFKWLAESMVAGRMILAINASSTPATIPMVVIQGEKDRVVTAAAQNQFCQSIPSCILHIIAGAKHELLMEEDDKRNQVVAVITRFLKQHSSA